MVKMPCKEANSDVTQPPQQTAALRDGMSEKKCKGSERCAESRGWGQSRAKTGGLLILCLGVETLLQDNWHHYSG